VNIYIKYTVEIRVRLYKIHSWNTCTFI